jgi:RNA polymerase sigma factor (sigma-70 family)
MNEHGYQYINQIIQGCCTGDVYAQKQLYDVLYEMAMNLAIRYSRDMDDAENIVAYSFVKLFNNIHRFDQERGSVYAWFKKIVIHEALDFIKAREKFEPSLEPSQMQDIPIANTYETHIATEQIMMFIRLLPMPTRAVFNLYIIEGYTHEEIGNLLQMSPGNSKWHLNKARSILQQQINQLSHI